MIRINGQHNDLHDSIMWAMRFDDNLFFDIDCLIGCEKDGKTLLNLIVPITLVFYDVENFRMNVECEWINGMEIDMIRVEETKSELKINVVLQEGEITFVSKTYKALLKGDVIKTTKSCLTEEERGGYNFEN